MDTPRISLCVAMYKVAQYLPRFVASLAKQPNLDEMEFIFVNDASPDNSAQVLEQELAKYPELKAQTRILTHAENQGISQTHQDGLEAAQGTYVTWADPDDWMDPGMYQALADKADEAQSDLVWSDYWRDSSEGSTLVQLPCEASAETFFINMMNFRLPTAGALWMKLFRRDFVVAHQVCFPDGRISFCEDLLFTERFLYYRPKMVYLPKAWYHYWIRPGSAMRTLTAAQKSAYLEILCLSMEATRSEAERREVFFRMQERKRQMALTPQYWVPYTRLMTVFPEITNVKGAGRGWIVECLFVLALQGPVRLMIARALYLPFRGISMVIRCICNG